MGVNGTICTCLTGGIDQRRAASMQAWVVEEHGDRSSFNGTIYYDIRCTRCRARWRTRAKYARLLRVVTP